MEERHGNIYKAIIMIASTLYRLGFEVKILSSVRVERQVRAQYLAAFQAAALHRPVSPNRGVVPMEAILSGLDGEVGERDLVSVPGQDVRDAKIRGVHSIIPDAQLVVPAIVEILPLQLAVRSRQPGRAEICRRQCDVLPGGAGELMALPANSTPTEPLPVAGSYSCWSSQTRSETHEACESPASMMVLLIL